MNLEQRARTLNNIEIDNRSKSPVFYVMSRDQRVEDNHALLYSQTLGDVIVLFNLYLNVPNRIYQQYEFMVDGLKEVQNSLKDLSIPFIVMKGKALDNLRKIEEMVKPKAFVFDFSPLRGPTNLKKSFAKCSKTPILEVDTHNIIPVWQASDKEEFGAYTLRPKIYKNLAKWLIEPEKVKPQKDLLSIVNLSTTVEGTYLNPTQSDWDELMKTIKAKNIPDYQPLVIPGSAEARKTLRNFLTEKVEFYAEKRNDPTLDNQSNLSAYLHYGHISSLRVVLEIQKLFREELSKDFDLHLYKNKSGVTHKGGLEESVYAFIEEIVVRKELADNYCYYNSKYDKPEGARDWALKSHIKHYNDKREIVYSYDELEKGYTHDEAWNTAQKQLVTKGKIHGYMRMYWAKKILEWAENPRQALEWAIKLNDTYHLDGYDPNGYVGIQWSINGLHDRPWFERPIFGQIRYMNYAGLQKKFKIKNYKA